MQIKNLDENKPVKISRKIIPDLNFQNNICKSNEEHIKIDITSNDWNLWEKHEVESVLKFPEITDSILFVKVFIL